MSHTYRTADIPRPGKIEVVSIEDCGRCGGRGGWEGWPGWTCYECGGHRRVTRLRKIWHVPTAWTDDEVTAWEAKREAQAEARAAKRAEKKAAEEAAVWAANCEAYPGLAEAAAWIDEHGAADWVRDIREKASRFELSEKQAAAVVGYPGRQAAAVAAEAERKTRAHHVGTVGQRVELTAQVAFTKWIDGFYGLTLLAKMETADGATLAWFGAGKAADQLAGLRGEWVTATWGIKEHSEYEGVPETRLSRPTKVRRAAPPELAGRAADAYLAMRDSGADDETAREAAGLLCEEVAA